MPSPQPSQIPKAGEVIDPREEPAYTRSYLEKQTMQEARRTLHAQNSAPPTSVKGD